MCFHEELLLAVSASLSSSVSLAALSGRELWRSLLHISFAFLGGCVLLCLDLSFLAHERDEEEGERKPRKRKEVLARTVAEWGGCELWECVVIVDFPPSGEALAVGG